MLPLAILCVALQTPTALVPVMDGLNIGLASSPLADVRRDAVEQAIIQGSLKAPTEGQTIDGHAWRTVKADKDGWFQGANGYLEVTLKADRDKTVLIQPEGASFFYVNGEPRVGDVYSSEYVTVPVRLR